MTILYTLLYAPSRCMMRQPSRRPTLHSVFIIPHHVRSADISNIPSSINLNNIQCACYNSCSYYFVTMPCAELNDTESSRKWLIPMSSLMGHHVSHRQVVLVVLSHIFDSGQVLSTPFPARRSSYRGCHRWYALKCSGLPSAGFLPKKIRTLQSGSTSQDTSKKLPVFCMGADAAESAVAPQLGPAPTPREY